MAIDVLGGKFVAGDDFKKEEALKQRLLKKIKKHDLNKRIPPVCNMRKVNCDYNAMADDILRVLSAYGFEIYDMELAFTIARYKLTGILSICTQHDGKYEHQ
ncbi:MAG: hypothetical protein IKT32_02455 [Clostridia bacterium]|nr:hypothetical protein [Clostridia bacterium]